MCGSAVAIFRLQKKTPWLISVAVAQWSPDHFLLLFSTTAAADRAERVLPAHAVAVEEADLQVGRHLDVLALVDVVALVDVGEDPLARLGVRERQQLRADLLLQLPVLLAGRDDALGSRGPSG